MSLPRLALTAGEPAGIGPELVARLAASDLPADLVAIADPALLAQAARAAGIELSLRSYDGAPVTARARGELRVVATTLSAAATPGRLDPRNAPYVLATLARQASPGDVVLCPEDMRHAVIGLTRCRLLIGDFAESMAPRAALEARLAQVRAFWTSWDRQEVREELLQSWGARFVVAPHSDAMTDEIAARHGLRRLQSNSRYALFRYDEARAAGGKTQPRPD